MGKIGAIALGILTFSTLICGLLFFISFGLSVSTTDYEGPEEFFRYFAITYIIQILLLIGFVIQLPIFYYHLYKTKSVPSDKKSLWAVILTFANVFAMPVYWIHFVWKPMTQAATSRGHE
jgi:hypothetical protein